MQQSIKKYLGLQVSITLIALFTLVFLFSGCKKGGREPVFEITTVATGLAAPMGIETDRWGNIWVAITGTGVNDGKVIVIKPNGQKFDAIINLTSRVSELSGELGGPAHLLIENGHLYVLAGEYLSKLISLDLVPDKHL